MVWTLALIAVSLAQQPAELASPRCSRPQVEPVVELVDLVSDRPIAVGEPAGDGRCELAASRWRNPGSTVIMSGLPPPR
jgi:hypothetical protein